MKEKSLVALTLILGTGTGSVSAQSSVQAYGALDIGHFRRHRTHAHDSERADEE